MEQNTSYPCVNCKQNIKKKNSANVTQWPEGGAVQKPEEAEILMLTGPSVEVCPLYVATFIYKHLLLYCLHYYFFRTIMPFLRYSYEFFDPLFLTSI